MKCPVCERVTAYLDQHLADKHKIARGSLDNMRLKAMALPYEGTHELEYIKTVRNDRKLKRSSSTTSCKLLSEDPLLPGESESYDETYCPSEADVIPQTPRPKDAIRSLAQEAADCTTRIISAAATITIQPPGRPGK